jgi:hypothetical protein
MPNVQFLGVSVLGESSFTDLQQKRKDIEGLIQGLDRWDMKAINQFPCQSSDMHKGYQQLCSKLQGEINIIVGKVFYCEINLDKSTPVLISQTKEIFSMENLHQEIKK